MPCLHKKGKKHRKHTEIKSEAQRRLFYAVASGKETKATGLTVRKARQHLAEVKDKELPARK